MKLKVTCPHCGYQFEGEVLKSMQNENFMVCHHEVNVTRGNPVIHYYCNTYIPITTKEIMQRNK